MSGTEKLGLHDRLSSGRIELAVGERVFELQAGDGFSFDSRLRHRCANPSASDEAIAVWADTPITLRP